MKNKISVFLFLSILLLAGCQNQSSKRKEEGFLTNIEQTVDSTGGKENANGDTDIDDNNIGYNHSELPATKDVKIYTISNEGTETIDNVLTVTKETDITADYIVELVIADLADKSYVVEVNEVTLKDDVVIIDFKDHTPPVTEVELDVENAMLDAFAFSIIDNISNCNGVMFRTNGSEYRSNNQEFSLDSLYLIR